LKSRGLPKRSVFWAASRSRASQEYLSRRLPWARGGSAAVLAHDAQAVFMRSRAAPGTHGHQPSRAQPGPIERLKKWLGSRQADRNDNQPLTLKEAQYFRSMVLRVATILALHRKLDELYDQASAANAAYIRPGSWAFGPSSPGEWRGRLRAGNAPGV
jgi:hypothetical protein